MGKVQCDGKMEIWTRVVGFYRPTNGFNRGKKEEYGMRKEFDLSKETEEVIRDKVGAKFQASLCARSY